MTAQRRKKLKTAQLHVDIGNNHSHIIGHNLVADFTFGVGPDAGVRIAGGIRYLTLGAWIIDCRHDPKLSDRIRSLGERKRREIAAIMGGLHDGDTAGDRRASEAAERDWWMEHGLPYDTRYAIVRYRERGCDEHPVGAAFRPGDAVVATVKTEWIATREHVVVVAATAPGRLVCRTKDGRTVVATADDVARLNVMPGLYDVIDAAQKTHKERP